MLICFPQQPWEQNIKLKQDSPTSFLKKIFGNATQFLDLGLNLGHSTESLDS